MLHVQIPKDSARIGEEGRWRLAYHKKAETAVGEERNEN